MDTVDLVQNLMQYGIAGLALYFLFIIANHKLTNIEMVLMEVREEIKRLREILEKR